MDFRTQGNEIADKLAELAARTMVYVHVDFTKEVDRLMENKKVMVVLKKKVYQKWNWKCKVPASDRFHECFISMGERICIGDKDRNTLSAVN